LFANPVMASAARRQVLDFTTKNRLPTMFVNRE
jgi:hypothetical protein